MSGPVLASLARWGGGGGAEALVQGQHRACYTSPGCPWIHFAPQKSAPLKLSNYDLSTHPQISSGSWFMSSEKVCWTKQEHDGDAN